MKRIAGSLIDASAPACGLDAPSRNPIGGSVPAGAASSVGASDAGRQLALTAPPTLPVMPQHSPRTVIETGLSQQLIVELIAKCLYSGGKTALTVLAHRLKLPSNILADVLGFMIAERLALLARRGDGYFDVDYQLTDAGRDRAAAFMLRCRYAGPAPVTLEAYRAMVLRQSVRFNRVTQKEIDAAFADVVLSNALRDQVGSAMNSGRSLFLFGPPGSGKSTLAMKLGGLMHGQVYIPHAIVVDDEIIQLYDPQLHRTVAPHNAPPAGALCLIESGAPDQRWMLCERPVVHSGGELTLDMLGLRYDDGAGYYQAPPHFKANNGVFIVDDLGCQRMPVRDLVNRWLVPLDRGCDHLCLHTGYQFAAPFDVALVFASSQEPEQLADAAFMRRMAYKVHLGALSESEYRTVTRAQCTTLGMRFDESAFRYLVGHLHRSSGRPRLAVYPRDLLALIADHARYMRQPPLLSAQTLDRAWNSYFATDCPAGDAVAGRTHSAIADDLPHDIERERVI